MSDTTHISKEDFYAFKHNLMIQTSKELFLEHICTCDYCSDQFATMMSEEIIEAPKDLKANILQATKRPEVQLAIMVKQTSKRMQLLAYSLKVGTATAVALLLLVLSINLTDISNNQTQPEGSVTDISSVDDDYVPLTAVIRNNMDAISDNMLDFSNTIMNTEVTNND